MEGMEGGKGDRLTWEEEGGQTESESPPASSGARKPHPSHRRAGVPRKGRPGGRSSRSRNQPGRRGRIAGGRLALGGSRSAAAVGRGGMGWVGSARPQSGPGLPPAQSLGRCPPQVARVMPPSPPPLSSLPRSPPSPSTQSGAGERDPPPARPAARLAQRRLPALGALTPSRSAPTCRRPWPAVLRGWPGGAEGSGPRRWCAASAASCPRGSGPSGLGGAMGASRVRHGSPPLSLRPVRAIRNNVELPGSRGEPRLLLSLSFSHSPIQPLTRSPVMSARGEGLALTPSWLPRARPNPGPASASAPTPPNPRQLRLRAWPWGPAQAASLARCPSSRLSVVERAGGRDALPGR